MKNLILRHVIRMSKLFTYAFLFQCLTMGLLLASNGNAQIKSIEEVVVRLPLEAVPVKDAFKKIERVSDFTFVYLTREVRNLPAIFVEDKDQSLYEVLVEIARQTGLDFKQINHNIHVHKSRKGQEKSIVTISKVEVEISGTVTDENGSPIPGATILVEGTDTGTVTDIDGKFSLEAEEGAVLLISFIGYQSQRITVGNKSTLNITLREDLESLEEVVVTALGITKKEKSLGYAVDKLSGDELSASRETNLVNSLQGKVAGIKITPASSGMGGSSRVIIRGNASLTGNNQPLFIVDGIPIDNSGFGGVTSNSAGPSQVRTDYGSGISDINPNDIESMTVLKGPNAAALYGNRAANGAIIITTKTGRSKPGLGIDYNTSFMFNKIHEGTLPRFQNEYGQGSGGVFAPDTEFSWGERFDGRTFTYPSGVSGIYSAQPNNVSDFYETGTEFVNTIALSNSSEKTNFRFSYTNFDGKGVMPNSELSKNTFNLRIGSNLSDKLSFDSKITYFIQDAQNRPVMGWASSRNVNNVLYRLPRNAGLRDFENYYIDDQNNSISPVTDQVPAGNPYYMQYRIRDEDERSRVQGMVKLTYAFNENFSMFARVGTDALSHKISLIMPWGSDPRTVRGSRSDSRYQLSETNADFLMMFNKNIGGDFNINLNAGGNYRYNRNIESSRSGQDFKIPTSFLYSNLDILLAGTESMRRSAVHSLYFSGSFDYQEKIYLNVTGRNDWDSGLWTPNGTSDEWSFFYPSVSLSLLGNELLGIDSRILSFSKLRIAWSEVGSGGFKSDQIYYSLGNFAGYNGLISVSQSNIFDDPDLGPEFTQSSEVGVELKFFNNRLYTDFTLYNSSTKDQIVNAPVDASTGFQFMRTNVGEITNKGYELMIGGTPVQTNNFYWDIALNMARNISTLESFIEGSDSYFFGGRDNFAIRTNVGGRIGDIWGNDFVFNNGRLVVDQNGVPVASAEEQLLGNYYPDLSGGLVNTFGYKSLSLKILIDGQLGGEAINWTSQEAGRYGNLERTLEGREGMVLDAVVGTGTAENPDYEANTVETNAEAYWAKLQGIPAGHIEDLTNIRLREVNLAYSLPTSVLANTFINRASVSIVGRNLFFIMNKAVGVDPETSVSSGNGQGIFYYNMPSLRRYGVSLNISF
ncbi:MAG: SusC/RagA family TonB-linked outer membrane protein [Cyclobacteriaceae bacterium]